MMKRVVRWAIDNAPAMNVMVIAVLIIGAVSLIIMRREVFPEFELEIVLVSVPYPGASPEEVEEAICEKIEAAVKGVSGVNRVTSVAQEGSGSIVIELKESVWDVQKVLNEIRSRIDQIPSFPDTAEDPDVRQIVFRAPAINIGILGPPNSGLPELQQQVFLRELAEEIRDEILQLTPTPPSNPLRRMFAPLIASPSRPAISTAEIVAARALQIDVEIPEDTLRQYGLSLPRVAQILRQQNIELPAGTLITPSQELLLRGKNKRSVGTEIADIPILAQTSGDVVTVGDLGNVMDGFVDTASMHLINGRPALAVTVSRTSDEDLFTVVETVKQYINEKRLPQGYEIALWNDISIDVRDRVEMLTRNGVTGLLLVFLVLALFLDLRLAFWVALGIPIAVLGAGFILLITGQTLNMLTMFAFLLVLGIVVDDAIVIGENIFTKHSAGMSWVRAAVEGTSEVFPAVCASVSTTIIAFLPLMFISGVMGKFIAVMPVAVIAMLVISLVEAVFVLPAHLGHERNLVVRIIVAALFALRFLLTPFRRVNHLASSGLQRIIDRRYVPFMQWVMNRKLIVASAATAILILTLGIIAGGLVPFDAFPKLDSRTISATVVFPDGTNEVFAGQATALLEEKLRQVDRQIADETGASVVSLVYRRVGEVGNAMQNPVGVTNGSHVGTVEVELVNPSNRVLTSEEIIRRWRNAMPELPGVEILRFESAAMGPGGKQIEFRLMADRADAAYLEMAARECKEFLATRQGVFDIEDDSRPGKWEMILRLNEQGRAMQLDERVLANTVRAAYYGEEVMRLQRGRHEVKLMVRYPEEERKSLSRFKEIKVRDDSGLERPITEVADISFERSASRIHRLNQKRTITVTADVNKTEGGNAFLITQEMRNEFLPDLFKRYQDKYGARLNVNWEGQQQQTMESLNSMFSGYMIALIGMFVLLTLQFRSYLQPTIIMIIIPFGFIGAVVGHGIMGLELTLFSFFGLVALTGVIVNDSIVLVDFINRRLSDGFDLQSAVIEAGRQRFRPVLLTTLTTSAGLIPVLMETSFQAQVVIPMAVTLVFGLLTTTVLVLVLVPLIYAFYGLFVETFGDGLPHARSLASGDSHAH